MLTSACMTHGWNNLEVGLYIKLDAHSIFNIPLIMLHQIYVTKDVISWLLLGQRPEKS